jgi:hypothetical protein
MRTLRGGLKFCAFYVACSALMLTLAYFSNDERTSDLLNLLVWWPGASILFGAMRFFQVQHFPFNSGWPTGLLVAAMCVLAVFLIGAAFTAIKNRLS